MQIGIRLVKMCQGLGVSGVLAIGGGVGDQQGCWQSAACFLQHTAHVSHIMRCTLWCLDVQQEGNKQTALAPSAPSLFATKRNWHVLLFDTNIDTLMSTRWAGG